MFDVGLASCRWKQYLSPPKWVAVRIPARGLRFVLKGGQLLLNELKPVQSRLPCLFDAWTTRSGDHTRRLFASQGVEGEKSIP
jgi:hypothetical protein